MQKVDVLDQRARKAAKNYMGDFAWPTVLMGSCLLVAYVATLVSVTAGLLSVWAALPIIVFLSYLSYTVLHEAVHGSINGSHASLRWVNELMGYLAGLVLMVPLTAHRHQHLIHHRYTNDPQADPDAVYEQLGESPFRAVTLILGLTFSAYRYYFKNRWQVAPRRQNIYFCLEMICAVSLRLAFVAQGFWLEGFVLFVLGILGGSSLLLYLFAYLPHRPYVATGRYLDTATVVVPGVLGKCVTALWGFQNYHSIHHLFPRVPFYRYTDVFNEIEEIMISKSAPIYRLGFRGLAPISYAPQPA